MIYFSSDLRLDVAFRKDLAEGAAAVSLDVPLLSNQDVLTNIALIRQYHENLPKSVASEMALDGLRQLGMAHIAFKRNPALNDEERFCAMLLRATMLPAANLAIDRPLKMIPHLSDASHILEILKKIDNLYSSCHIYDYEWMKDKYGVYNP